MKKAALLIRDIKAGEELNIDMIAFKRTGETSDCSQLEVLSKIGTKMADNLKKGSIIYKKNFVSG
jgi:sialic acid synthase SpsE